MKQKKIVEISAKEIHDKIREILNMPNGVVEEKLKKVYPKGGDFRDDNSYYVLKSITITE